MKSCKSVSKLALLVIYLFFSSLTLWTGSALGSERKHTVSLAAGYSHIGELVGAAAQVQRRVKQIHVFDDGIREVNHRIVRIARTQIGVGEDPSGSNCTKYGPCEYWCARFLTWVWRRAGVDIPSFGFTGDVYTWARQHGQVHGTQTRPHPGWAVLFGSGPGSTDTSVHIGLVTSVGGNGQMTIIDGNHHDRVNLNRSCHPGEMTARACDEPSSIYGYAAPTVAPATSQVLRPLVERMRSILTDRP